MPPALTDVVPLAIEGTPPCPGVIVAWTATGFSPTFPRFLITTVTTSDDVGGIVMVFEALLVLSLIHI